MKNRAFVDAKTLAERFGVSRQTITSWARAGRIPALRIAGQYRFADDIIEAFEEGKMVEVGGSSQQGAA